MVNSQLESWVEKKIQEGLSLNQIEQQLREQGWDEKSIQEAENMARQRLNTNQSAQPDRTTRETTREKSMDYTGIGSRMMAYVIDTVLQGFISGAIIVGLALLATFGLQTPDVLANVIIPIIFLGYFVFFEAKSGQTPGKKMLDMKVVNTDGSSIGYKESIVRNLLRIIDALIVFYMIGIAAVFITDKSQRIGDLAAGTVVVET